MQRVVIDLTGDFPIVLTADRPKINADQPSNESFINFDDEPEQPKRNDRKRLHKKMSREEEIVSNYEFMQEEVVINIELEESENKRAKNFIVEDDYLDREEAKIALKEMRNNMGIVDEKVAFEQAFNRLANGHWELFLEHPIIKRKFRPVDTVLESFGVGLKTALVKELYQLYWDDNLIIKELKYIQQGECIACGGKRKLCYKFFRRDGVSLGVMGTDCYSIRFGKIVKLIDVCKAISRLHGRGEADLHQLIECNFFSVLDAVCSTNQKMRLAYQ